MPGWRDRSFHKGLLAIAAGALLLRLIVLVLHLGTPVPVDNAVVAHAGALAGPDGGGIAQNADLIAQVDAEGDQATPPLWPVVRTVGTLGLGGDAGHQLVAAVLGTLTVVLVGFAGYRLGGRRTGLVAAGVAALYPGLWIYESAAMAESLLVLGVAATALLAFAYFDRPRWPLAVGLGACAGLLALVRTEQLLVLPLVVLPLIVVRSRGDRRRTAIQVGAAVATTVLVVMPWWAFTTATHEGTVPVSAGLGADLVAGACRPTLTGSAQGLSDPRCAFNVGSRLEGAEATDAAARDAALADRAVANLDEHGQRTPFTVAVRVARATGILGASQIVAQWSAWSHQPAPVIWLWLLSGLALAVLAVRGALTLRDHRIPLLPLLGFVGVAAASAAVFGGDLRYRAAAAVPLVLLGAVGLTWRELAPPLQRRRGKRRPPAVAWRSTMPDDFWDDLVERLARMDDAEPLSASASAVAREQHHQPAGPTPPRAPQPEGGAAERTSPATERPSPAASGDVIDLRDLPPPPTGADAPGRSAPPASVAAGDEDVIDLRHLPPPPVDVAPWPEPVGASGRPVSQPAALAVGAAADARAADVSAQAGAAEEPADGIDLRDLLRPRSAALRTPVATVAAGPTSDAHVNGNGNSNGRNGSGNGRNGAAAVGGARDGAGHGRNGDGNGRNGAGGHGHDQHDGAATGAGAVEGPRRTTTAEGFGLPLPPPPRTTRRHEDPPRAGATDEHRPDPAPSGTAARTAARSAGAHTGRTGAPPSAKGHGTARAPAHHQGARPTSASSPGPPPPSARREDPPADEPTPTQDPDHRLATRFGGSFRAR